MFSRERKCIQHICEHSGHPQCTVVIDSGYTRKPLKFKNCTEMNINVIHKYVEPPVEIVEVINGATQL